ncbi:UNVERIFIED_CONTAM: hypothetical protein Sradi_6122500 [Sesamum radiatum]|uniref:Reverse transcriptase zinc-binding domain-containing protein n=1 Tax=Sesamum radiatum TaxID=300843 RepID=A0AAW2KJ71_SESRA
MATPHTFIPGHHTQTANRLPSQVSELIDEESREWNEGLISTLFWPKDSELILQIPLCLVGTKDLHVWHYSSNGIFSVRSAYHIALSLFVRVSSSGLHWPRQMWHKKWQAKMPNKENVFIWRAIRDILPTESNLHKRIPHEVFCFPLARQWQKLLFTLFSSALSHDRWSNFPTTTWPLSSHSSPRDCQVQCRIDPFGFVPFLTASRLTLTEEFLMEDELQVLEVLRNARGVYVAWLSLRLTRGGSAEMAEAFAAREAIRLALQHMWPRVILEADRSNLLHKLSSNQPDLSAISILIVDVLFLSSFFTSIFFFFCETLRQFNC